MNLGLKILIALIACTMVCAVHGQTLQPERSLDFGIGYSHFRMLDRQVTPLIYRSHIIPLSIGVTQSSKNYFHADFGISVGAHRSRDFQLRRVVRRFPNQDGELSDDVYKVSDLPIMQQSLAIEYLWGLPSTNGQFKTYVGASVTEFFSISFTPTAIFVINDLTLNPTVRSTYELGGNQLLYSQLSFPLTGLMVRMPYANDPADGKNGSFVSVYTMGTDLISPLDYQRVNFIAGYRRPVSNKWLMSAEYHFSWFHYQPKRGLTAYNNEIKLLFSKIRKPK